MLCVISGSNFLIPAPELSPPSYLSHAAAVCGVYCIEEGHISFVVIENTLKLALEAIPIND